MRNSAGKFAVLFTTLFGFALIALGAGNVAYGSTLFLGVPVLTGYVPVLIYASREPRTLPQCLRVSLWPFIGIAVLLLTFGVEGLICIAMEAVLAVPLGLLGGYIAWRLHGNVGRATTSALMLLIPAGLHGPQPHMFSATTSIVVNAPPEMVWKRVTDFPAIGARPAAIFQAGVAYPLETEIDGSGFGAARRCILSTGKLDEHVTAWNPPFLLQFRVDSTPPAMHELSPWPNIDPPHLHGFYVSYQGEFRLTELPGHKTLVEGTSWYSHGLEPAQYWRLWSDYVVHSVHRRVLEHIKTLAEDDYLRRAAR